MDYRSVHHLDLQTAPPHPLRHGPVYQTYLRTPHHDAAHVSHFELSHRDTFYLLMYYQVSELVFEKQNALLKYRNRQQKGHKKTV